MNPKPSALSSDRRLVIYTGAFELPDKNAASGRVLNNSKILRELGYRVVLLGVNTEENFSADVRKMPGGVDGFEAWETPRPKTTRDWFRRITTIDAVRCVVESEGPETLRAIIAYNYPAVAQARLVNYAHALGASGVADVTEWYGTVRGFSPMAIVKNLDIPLRMKGVNPRMDGLFTTSPFISDYYGRRVAPILEIPTLMNNPPAARAAGRASQDGRPKRLFFAGSGFDPKAFARSRAGLKDQLDQVIALLSEAARRGAAFEFDIYGVTRAAYEALIPAQAPVLDELGDRLRFHGRKPREELLGVLEQADFSIFFRRRTRANLAGFPSKYSESISHGTPVITNAMPNLEPYHRDGETGFFIDPYCGKDALDRLMAILSMTANECQGLKDACAASPLFHYETYKPGMAEFMGNLQPGRTEGLR